MPEKATPSRKVSDKSTKQELLEACGALTKLLVDQGRKTSAEK